MSASPYAVTAEALSSTLPSSGAKYVPDIWQGVEIGARLADTPKLLPNVPLWVLLALCSTKLGEADPWLERDRSGTVAFAGALVPRGGPITLGEARQLALDFNRRVEEAYARQATAEAESEARWESLG